MKKFIISTCLLYSVVGFAQNKSYLSNRYALERMGTLNVGTNPVMPGLPMAAPEVMGDPYIKKNQSLGTVLLYNDQVFRGMYTKYDLLQDEFYFFTKQGIRVVNGNQVKSFVFQDSLTQKESTYINAKEFKLKSGVPLIGFFEVVFDGQTALLKKTDAIVIKANYNVALSVGRKDHTITKKTAYYYLMDNFINELPEKKITSIFEEQQGKMDKFIKVNQLNLKDERHLSLLFENYNQIINK